MGVLFCIKTVAIPIPEVSHSISKVFIKLGKAIMGLK
jgi:hypothetical protein